MMHGPKREVYYRSCDKARELYLKGLQQIKQPGRIAGGLTGMGAIQSGKGEE